MIEFKKPERLSEQRKKELKRQYVATSPKQDPLDLLTKEVVRRILRTKFFSSNGHSLQKKLLYLWLKSQKVEHLPNGIPYKVVDDYHVNSVGATFITYLPEIGKLNAPLILVSSRLPSEVLRRNSAMHEFLEWSRLRSDFISSFETKNEAHDFAVKSENPRLRKESTKIRQEFHDLVSKGEIKSDFNTINYNISRDYSNQLRLMKKQYLKRKGILGTIQSWFI